MNMNTSTERLCGLERMGILLNLSANIFYAQALLDKRDVPHFDALPRHVKHFYLELAIECSTRLPAAVTRPSESPDACPVSAEDGVTRPVDYFAVAARAARADAARVIGFISPSEPWGLDTSDPTPRPGDARD